MAEHDGDDMHDWDTFNQQIEKLLLSMQKTDRTTLVSPLPNAGPNLSLSRTAGRGQRPTFVSILEHADLRQNLSESAFEQAAETEPHVYGRALADDLPLPNSAAASQTVVQLTPSSPEIQPSDEELPRSTGARADESAMAQMNVSNARADAQCLVATQEKSTNTAQEQDMHSLGAAEQPSIDTQADGQMGMQKQLQPEENPYRVLLQQIDLHIATCQASLASIYPVERAHVSAEPATPAQAESAQATSPFPAQRSVYRNELYEALPESLDSPCLINVTASRRKAMAAVAQLPAEEIGELMAAEAVRAEPFGSPAVPLGEAGPGSAPAAGSPCAADASAQSRDCTAEQQAALVQQHVPQDRVLDAEHHIDQAPPTAASAAEDTSAGQSAPASGGAEPLEASSAPMDQDVPLPQTCSDVLEVDSAGQESAEPSGSAEQALQAAASGDGSVLETLDAEEEEQPQLIAAWWPPGAAQPEQAAGLPGPGSREPGRSPLGTPSSGLPQRAVSVEIRDAEQCTPPHGQPETTPVAETGHDTGRSPCRILRLSLSPPCSSHREHSAGEAAGRSPTQSFPAEVMHGPHKENTSPELPGSAHAQDAAAPERKAARDGDAQGLCGAVASPTADLHGQELQAWQQHSAAGLLEVYQDMVLQDHCDVEPLHAQLAAAPPTEGLDTADERAHQAEVARRDLETRLGAHAVELAERDTQVAYLSSAVGLAEDLLTAKQRKVEELSGESLGLQDVLSEAGAEAAAKAMRLTELEAETQQQRAQLAQVQQQLAEREQQLAQCRAELADAQRQLAAAQAASPSPFASTPSALSRSSHTPGMETLGGAHEPKPLLATTPLQDTTLHQSPFTTPGARQPAGSPMPASLMRGLHGAAPGSGARAQRSAWEAVTPPLSHGKRTTEALTAVLRRIRSREETL